MNLQNGLQILTCFSETTEPPVTRGKITARLLVARIESECLFEQLARLLHAGE